MSRPMGSRGAWRQVDAAGLTQRFCCWDGNWADWEADTLHGGKSPVVHPVFPPHRFVEVSAAGLSSAANPERCSDVMFRVREGGRWVSALNLVSSQPRLFRSTLFQLGLKNAT